MNEDLVEATDLDWFGVLSNGSFAHFATAGIGYLPSAIRNSVENYELAFEYFNSLKCFTDCFVVEENLPDFPDDSGRKRYITPFAEMASRGLYSYDASKDGGYKLIAVPAVELGSVSLSIVNAIPSFKIGPLKIIFPGDLV
ncbi:hypothetical protein [Pseudomonas sp.]|uniref:hypothetical protein n=1 Tax=Pseudomonas sp. TaxID=306 RepID=UPI0031E3C79D